eukprot:CAMPEP_0178461438 /NCGR_PEP_ID=MMETSP0689_2-20121128/49314_1 /TAXON_ID=160604 /ORGANISM="Amphidinium massartii, Strain CS-259" /LENGTH=50 /DNA_ID=CAMNT_0020088283 /DNA_START=18 /DNA_END=166 /DNA_ORIENTATION=-
MAEIIQMQSSNMRLLTPWRCEVWKTQQADQAVLQVMASFRRALAAPQPGG